MTQTGNISQSVTELQEWLRALHFSGYPINLIIPDGVYNSQTKEAVSQFQRFIGLPVTGIVDRSTWDALYGAYKTSEFERSRPNALYPFPESVGYILTPGEVSDIVMIIQIMIDTLSGYYDGISVEVNGRYDEQTRLAVEEFQKANELAVTGHIDKATWNRLADVYNRFNNIDT